MTSITDDEWKTVQEALVRGGLRECIERIVANHTAEAKAYVKGLTAK